VSGDHARCWRPCARGEQPGLRRDCRCRRWVRGCERSEAAARELPCSSTAIYDADGRLLRLALAADDRRRCGCRFAHLTSTRRGVSTEGGSALLLASGVEPFALARADFAPRRVPDASRAARRSRCSSRGLLYRLQTRSVTGKVSRSSARFSPSCAIRSAKSSKPISTSRLMLEYRRRRRGESDLLRQTGRASQPDRGAHARRHSTGPGTTWFRAGYDGESDRGARTPLRGVDERHPKRDTARMLKLPAQSSNRE